MNLYAYCLSGEVTADAIDSVAGVAGAPTSLIEHEGIRAVISHFDGKRLTLTRENIFAHERVIGHVLAHTTPLPFRFGMVVSRAQLEGYLEQHRAMLLASLARVHGAVEMSVKIIWKAGDRKMAGPNVRNENGAARMGAGAAFLAAKRREIAGREALKEQAEQIAAWLAEQIGPAVRESRVELLATKTMVVRAAHLVEWARMDEYLERLKRAREQREEIQFLTSGAWPPYSFTGLRS